MESMNETEEFKKKKVHLKMDALYINAGNEFRGVFGTFCAEQGIHIVVIDPNEGSKRRIGVVERFNRTLRRYFEFQWAKDKAESFRKLDIPHALPKVLSLYNFEKKHTGIRKFQRWTQGLEGNKEQMQKGLVATPFFMSTPGKEKQYQEFKEEKRDRMNDLYGAEIERMQEPGSKIRYFLRNKEKNAFYKSGKATVSVPFAVEGKHQYSTSGQEKSGDSFRLSGSAMRVTSFFVEKIRIQEFR